MTLLLSFEWFVAETLVERLGWVLLHSLWQFALVALLAGAAVRALRRNSASMRHGVLVVAVAVLTSVPLATWMLLPAESPPDTFPTAEAVVPVPDAIPVVHAEFTVAPLPRDRVLLDEATQPPLMQPPTPANALQESLPDALSSTATARHRPLWLEQVTVALQPWLVWIVAAWSCGAVLCSLRPLLGWHTLRRMRCVGLSPVSNDVLAAASRISTRLGVRRAVRVLQSALTQVPVVVGYVRPMILLPVSLLTNLPPDQWEAILAHELAHVRRHDFLINLLQTLAETLFFYHPAVWWLSHRIRIEREHCCDDLVVTLFNNRAEYGRALLAVEELRGHGTVLALGANEGSLLSRIRRIAGIEVERTPDLFDRWPVALLVLSCLGLLVALSISWNAEASGQENDAVLLGEATRSDASEERVDHPPHGVEAKELERFQGHWAVDSCESEAATLKASVFDQQRWRWTIQGNEITWGREGQEWKVNLTIDPTQTPNQIDLTFLDGPSKGEKCLGIYDWSGDDGKTLRILLHDPGAKIGRPTSFERKVGDQTSQITLHPLPPIDPVKELALWQGTWCWDYSQPWTWPQPIGVGTDSDGRKSEKRWVIEGNQITWVGRDGERVNVDFTIDPFKAPKQIEFTFLNGHYKGKQSIGIYELQNGNENNRWLCMTDPGSDAPRPTDISAGSFKKQSMIAVYRVAPPKPAVPKELERFQGFWQMDLCDTVNETLYLPNNELPKRRWFVKGNQIVWSQKGEEWRLQLKVDPSKSPRTIDLTYLSGPFAGKTCLGMYEFGGVGNKALWIAIQDPGANVPRPQKLEMTGTSQSALILLSPIEMSAAEQDLASLQGTWTLRNYDTGNLSRNKDPSFWPLPGGKRPEKSGEGSELRWTVKQNEITWTSPSGQEIKASFTIDPQQRPKQIDLTFLSGPDKGVTCPGIYQRDDLDENILWLCLADPGADKVRPQEFSYAWGKGRSLLSFYPFNPPVPDTTGGSSQPPVPAQSEDTNPGSPKPLPGAPPVQRPSASTPPKPSVETIPVVTENSLTKEQELFQRDWKFETCWSEKWPSARDEVRKWRWTIHGDQIAWQGPGSEVWKLSFTINPAGSPKEIDFVFLDGPHQGETCAGIYSTEGVGQEMWICLQDPGAKTARPVDFSGSLSELQGTGRSLLILHPVKPNSVETELASLQGAWLLSTLETQGWPEPIGKGPDQTGQGSEWKWLIEKNEIVWTSPQGEEIRLSFTIDPAKSPKHFDVTFLSGPDKGKNCPGLYERGGMLGKSLWLCLADPGSKAGRPADLSFTSYGGRSLMILHPIKSLGSEKAAAKQAAAQAISGIVRDAAGKPVADVRLVGTRVNTEVDFKNGVLSDYERPDRSYAVTDASGHYQFAPQEKEFGVFAGHGTGYVRKSAAELADSSDLTLEPWGRIEGTVTVLGKPLADVPVRITLDATDQHSMFYDAFDYDAKTDDQGRFSVEHVPAGVAFASTGPGSGEGVGSYGSLLSARKLIKPGETLTLSIGGGGRPVIGKLHFAEGMSVRPAGGRLVVESKDKRTAPEPPADAQPGSEQMFFHYFNFYRSPEGLANRLAERVYGIQIASDGSFRAAEVLPGTYTLSFWSGEDFRHPLVSREITVPLTDHPTTEPFDIGTVKIEPPLND
ncbi:TIGR03067 domain-containing protein [bacterium]|nr:TIGR03067 domain-containing protein [bacterium]